MHTTISALVTSARITSRRPSAYCESFYCTGVIVPQGWWNPGMEQSNALHFGACRVARGVYVTDHGDTSTRDCWTSQAQKIGRAD